jgi:O-antigen/teichoic acid export membrane protein
MSKVTRNAIANLIAKVWSTVLGLGVIPLYVNILGVESYGLVGVFGSLQAVMGLLDLGMQPTVSRELARLSALEPAEAAAPMRDLVRTFATVFALVGLVSGLVVLTASPFLVTHWIRADQLPTRTVLRAVGLMGLILALQWPSSLFLGGLMSLQQQVRANQIQIFIGTLRSLGALAMLRFVSPTIEMFFLTQALASATQTALAAVALTRALPPSHEPARFRLQVLREHWRFAAGMLGVALLSVILTQVDKMIVTGSLSLREVGFYSLATAVANALFNLIAPIVAACYPRLVQLVALGDEETLSAFYHRSCQVLAVVIIPPTVVIAAFSRQVLFAWTGRPDTAEHAHLVLTLLIAGTCFNGLMNFPTSLQIAHGWTRLIVAVNALAVLVIVPLEGFGARRWGARGAAVGWLILNASYVLFVVPLMHQRLLRGQHWRWYREDVLAPGLGAVLVGLLARLVTPPSSRPGALLFVAVVYALAAAVAALSVPVSREAVRAVLHRLRLRWSPPPAAL